MYTYGLEKEFFIQGADGKLTTAPYDLAHDECGYLAEARGKPFGDPVEAIYSLSADVYRLKVKAISLGLILLEKPVMRITKDLSVAAARLYNKGLIQYQNLYGHVAHPVKPDERTAGLHLSVVRTEHGSVQNGKKEPLFYEYRSNFDWPRLFVTLDKVFAAEIKKARRLPGFYEVKYDGRVEYRSLPNDVDLDKLCRVLRNFTF